VAERLCALGCRGNKDAAAASRDRSETFDKKSAAGIPLVRKACVTPRPAKNCRRCRVPAQAGAAEALYGIGRAAADSRRGGEDLARWCICSLSLYLAPQSIRWRYCSRRRSLLSP